MRNTFKMKEFSADYTNTLKRFLFMIIFLVAAFITNTISINKHEDFNFRWLVSFLLGASIYAVLQLIYERFYTIRTIRYFFMGLSLAFAVAYYLMTGPDMWRIEITVKTMVIFFILIIAFLWVPSLKSRINFNQSFLVVFKAFFITAFFYIILFLGVVIVLLATDLLIFDIQEESYAQVANLIFILLAPIHFLTLIPYYPNKEELNYQNEITQESYLKEQPLDTLQSLNNSNMDITALSEAELALINIKRRRSEALYRLTTPVKFLETLFSYVIIPLTTAFTIILMLYIIMNLSGEFWSNNLMEPLLVTYSITVIIVYLLTCTIHNTLTRYFRKYFPKILVVVVLFQTIASVLRTAEVGITYGRYYAIMFGVFATIAGVIFCVKPIHKNGLIAPVLITLSIISILPFVDAFTLSKITQTQRLENVLKKNGMFENEMINPNANISEKDKKTIISSLQYLNSLDYTKDITWLNEYSEDYDFEAVFGFNEYEQVKEEGVNISVYRKQSSPIAITGYDFIVRTNVDKNGSQLTTDQFEKDGKKYQFKLEFLDNPIIILEENEKELIRFDTGNIYSKYMSKDQSDYLEVETEEVTFMEDNSAATLTIIAENININLWQDGENQQAEIYILVMIK